MVLVDPIGLNWDEYNIDYGGNWAPPPGKRINSEQGTFEWLLDRPMTYTDDGKPIYNKDVDSKCFWLCAIDKGASAIIDQITVYGGLLPFDSHIAQSLGGYGDEIVDSGFYDVAAASGSATHHLANLYYSDDLKNGIRIRELASRASAKPKHLKALRKLKVIGKRLARIGYIAAALTILDYMDDLESCSKNCYKGNLCGQ